MKHELIRTAAVLAAMLACGVLPAHAAETEPTASETTVTTVTTAAETTETTTTTTIAAIKEGWEQRDGKRYYRLATGDYARGEVVIDGVPYLFGYSGAQKTDWQTVGGVRRYYDPATGEAVTGWVDYFGQSYYISPDEGKLTGHQTVKKIPFCFTPEGGLYTGTFFDGENTCFADPDSGEISKGLHKNGDGTLLTDADGVILYGWQTTADGKCYADPYTGLLCTEKFTVDGVNYCIDPATFMTKAGFLETADGICLTDADGRVLTGWQEYDGKRFYCAEDTGLVQYGLFSVGDAWYIGTKDGLLLGEQEYEGDRILCDKETGAVQFGWFVRGGKNYYLDPVSRHLCRGGFFKISGELYYFNADGSAGTGLTRISGVLFAFDAYGKRLTGLQNFDGVNYYFDPESGVALTGAQTVAGGTFRFGSDGKQVFGWHKVGEDQYYTDPVTGYVLPGRQEIDGEIYQFDEKGKSVPVEKIDGRLYDQNDPYWETIQFNERKGSTMKASACGIFSFCNAIYALNGNRPDAIQVAEWAMSVGAYAPGYGGTTRDKLYNNIEKRYGAELGFTLGPQCWGTIEDTRLQNHLMTGNVAVIHVPGHFMAAVGYDPATGLYHILESAESDSRGLEGDSWVGAAKMSVGNTKVDWFVLIYNR